MNLCTTQNFISQFFCVHDSLYASLHFYADNYPFPNISFTQTFRLLLFNSRNFYKANPRPDALMKEQIVEMSGLSPRVIRVWFQNKRCKDKKMQIKHEMQQERVSYFKFFVFWLETIVY